MSPRLLAFAGALLLALPSGGRPQGLGDVAAREKAKRQKQPRSATPEATPAYTDADLEAGRPPGSKPKTGESAAAAPAEYPPLEEPGREAAEAAAREGGARQARDEAIKAAQDRVSAAEARIAELRDKLNPMSGSFIYGATGSNSPNEEAQVRAELNEADRALAEARGQLDAAHKGTPAAAAGNAPH